MTVSGLWCPGRQCERASRPVERLARVARADRTEARERPADGAAAGTRGTSVSERGGATQAQARGPGSAPARSEDGGDGPHGATPRRWGYHFILFMQKSRAVPAK